jgi:hypothetical protein
MLQHSVHHHRSSGFPPPSAVVVAAIIAIAIGIGAYLLASRTSTNTVATPPATTHVTQPNLPELRGVLARSRIRVLDPTKPPF